MPIFLSRHEGRIGRAKSYAAPAACNLGGADAFRLFGLMARDADIINYHFPWPFADLLHLTIRPKVTTVMTWHSDVVRQKWLGLFYAPFMSRMISQMDALVATSPNYALTSRVLSRPGIIQRVHTIPLGITETSLPVKADNRIFARLNLTPDDPYFLFVGATRYYKGLRFLIRAATDISAKIVIAGTGNELAEITKYAKRFPNARVVFAGRVTDEEKVALLKHCYAFVLPSHLRSEAYGLVLVEASIYSKAMVSCEIGSGTSFVNLHNKTGLVVEPASPKALAAAMNHLLANSACVIKMGNSARHRYEKLFSGRAMGEAYIKLYKKLLQHGRPSIS